MLTASLFLADLINKPTNKILMHVLVNNKILICFKGLISQSGLFPGPHPVSSISFY